MTPSGLADLLDSVRCWVEGAIVAAGCPKPKRSYTAVGGIAWDTCDQLTVSVAGRIYRSVAFPTEYRGDDVAFAGFLVVPVAVVWTRCYPNKDGRGNAPRADVIGQSSGSVYGDAAVVWNLLEAGTLPNDEWERTGITQEFAGPQDGVVAIDTRVTIGVGHEVWC